MSYELAKITNEDYIRVNSIEDIADFATLSEPLFKIVRTIEPSDSGLIIMPKDLEVLFENLFFKINDYIDFSISSFYIPLVERSKELTPSKEGQEELNDILNKSQQFIGVLKKTFTCYKDVILKKFDEEHCFVPSSLQHSFSIYNENYGYATIRDKVDRYIKPLYELKDVIVAPSDIKKSFINSYNLRSQISCWRPLIICDNIKSLKENDYVVNKRVCKKLGLDYNIVTTCLKHLVDLLNDDSCPVEVVDIFNEVFVYYIPDLLSKNRGIFNRCKGDNYRLEKAIEKYNNYKKSGCYIEVVDNVE